MCAIVGSRSIEKLKELVELNSYRGSHSFSFSTFNQYSGILSIQQKKLGTIDLTNKMLAPNEYAIVHIQAPTTDARTADFIHPAVLNVNSQPEYNPDLALWHNGIIKAETVKNNIDKYSSSWDTMQILRALVQANSFSVLNAVVVPNPVVVPREVSVFRDVPCEVSPEVLNIVVVLYTVDVDADVPLLVSSKTICLPSLNSVR